MSLWRRLWGSGRPQRLTRLRELTGLAPAAVVELVGIVKVFASEVQCPISGRTGVALEYRAWPQSSTLGVDGLSANHSRAFELRCQQAVDFMLSDGNDQVLVRVDPGRDVATVHRDLSNRYGLSLRSEQALICEGTDVRVVGVVASLCPDASPHRSEPYLAEVQARQFWVVDHGL